MAVWLTGFLRFSDFFFLKHFQYEDSTGISWQLSHNDGAVRYDTSVYNVDINEAERSLVNKMHIYYVCFPTLQLKGCHAAQTAYIWSWHRSYYRSNHTICIRAWSLECMHGLHLTLWKWVCFYLCQNRLSQHFSPSTLRPGLTGL